MLKYNAFISNQTLTSLIVDLNLEFLLDQITIFKAVNTSALAQCILPPQYRTLNEQVSANNYTRRSARVAASARGLVLGLVSSALLSPVIYEYCCAEYRRHAAGPGDVHTLL